MAPGKSEKTPPKAPKAKKEKIFHPQSRKAGQINRSNLRKEKMSAAASKRNKKHASQADIYAFFYHALPPEGVFTLAELHALIQDVWLARHDAELDTEKAARRKGRPKSAKEMKMEEIKLQESEHYRTGMEVIDLTDPTNVQLFREWDQIEVAYVQLLRFLRISSSSPDVVQVARPGKHFSLLPKKPATEEAADVAMDIVADDPVADNSEAPPLLEHPLFVSSTTMMI